MIRRTYGCPECNTIITVELRGDQWQEGPPSCPACDAREMGQIFRPPAITGSTARRAADVALDIAEKDYRVADISDARGERGSVPKVRYRDPAPPNASTWGTSFNALQQAMAIGRQTRLESGGNGLDILQANLKSGAQVDLIEASKKRSMKIW